MTPELIIGIVSAIIGVGFVKVWLYKIITYKMDEGIVLKFFTDNTEREYYSVTEIAEKAELKTARVNSVCSKSSKFVAVEQAADSWKLNKEKG